MSRPRKSKRPADISISTPTSPAELVQNLTSLPQGDSRALVASSTAIALSIGISSAFHDVPETSSDGAAVRGRQASWQTAYSAAKMAIEMAKESSDMFPPLKAVTGAVSVLIKNYEVSALLL